MKDVKANVLAKSTSLKKKTKNKKGFTLVELVIVIAVLAIIAAIAIPTVSNVIKNANAAADKSNAQAIENAIKSFESENASYNTNKSDEVSDVVTTADAGKSDITTAYPITTLLTKYGVDLSRVGLSTGTDALKEGSGFHYFRDDSLGTVVAASSAPTGYKQISNGTTFTVTNGKVIITSK